MIKIFIFSIVTILGLYSTASAWDVIYSSNNYEIYSGKSTSDMGSGVYVGIRRGNGGVSLSYDNLWVYSQQRFGSNYMGQIFISGTGTIDAINSNYNSTNAEASRDGLYVYYESNSSIWKKNANDTSNGTDITDGSLSLDFGLALSPAGDYLYYPNGTDGYKLYKKSTSDSSTGSAINSNTTYYFCISPLGDYIYYRNGSDGQKMYKKSTSDTSNGTAITNTAMTANCAVSPDGTEIVYGNSNDGQKMYKKSTSDTSSGVLVMDYPIEFVYSYFSDLDSDGECGTNQDIYAYSATSFTGTFCSAGTVSPSSPVFPSAGASVSWSCIGSNSGTTSTCGARRESPPVPGLGICGSAVKLYGYSATDFSGSFCSAGTVSPSSPVFPSAGASVSWSCIGSNSGTTSTCGATRQDTPYNCQTPIPTGGNYGNLTYSPSMTNQPWIYSQNGVSCSYQCLNGYTGTGCTTAPVSETGSTTDTGFWGSITNPFNGFFNSILNFLGQIFRYEEKEAPHGIFFSGSLNPVSFGVGSRVGCGMNINSNGSWCVSSGQSVFNPDTKIWAYNWQSNHMYLGRCIGGETITNGSINTEKMIVDGKFTYLRDMYGNEITISNLINISKEWKLNIRSKYDIYLFGFSLINGLNSIIDILVSAVSWIIQYIMLVSNNLLDMVSMFFYNYQEPILNTDGSIHTSANACYFGDVYPIKQTIQETAITKTQNNGLLDMFFMVLMAGFVVKILLKKINS